MLHLIVLVLIIIIFYQYNIITKFNKEIETNYENIEKQRNEAYFLKECLEKREYTDYIFQKIIALDSEFVSVLIDKNDKIFKFIQSSKISLSKDDILSNFFLLKHIDIRTLKENHFFFWSNEDL